MTYKVFMKRNELGKLPNAPRVFDSLESAKGYCLLCFTTLGDPKFFDDSIDGNERILYTREYCASDFLGLIEKVGDV